MISWDSLSCYLDYRAITTAPATIQDLTRITTPTRMFFTPFSFIDSLANSPRHIFAGMDLTTIAIPMVLPIITAATVTVTTRLPVEALLPSDRKVAVSEERWVLLELNFV